MKKLLFVLLMALSGQVMAATEVVIPYINLDQGQAYTVTYVHNAGCVVAVGSIESGSNGVAVWMVSNSPNQIVITLYNISTPVSGSAILRAGGCQ